jgi:hypothetical protein
MFFERDKQPVKAPVAISHPNQLARFSAEVRRAIKQLSEKSAIGSVATPIKNAETSANSWSPIISVNGTTAKARFRPGTLNNVLPSNWNDEFSFSVTSDTQRYVVLNFTGASAKITGCNLQITTTQPTANSVDENSLANSGKVLLGVISGAKHFMLIKNNLLAYGNLVYSKGKVVSNAGGEPFDRYYQWAIVEAISQI